MAHYLTFSVHIVFLAAFLTVLCSIPSCIRVKRDESVRKSDKGVISGAVEGDGG